MKYRTIVADPPWEMSRSFGGANWRNGERDRPQLDYPTMELEEIASLPIRDWAEKSAHLYLWTTQRHLRDTYWVAEAWGFKPVATLVWCKPPGGFVGGTFYSNTEFVLFCRRGSLEAKQRINGQWFEWPRGEHSQKPDAFLDLVESVSPSPYLELFARRQRLGWDTWGNEALCHVEMSA
jgi:N6-adenosine-specific RNA methylase IME4